MCAPCLHPQKKALFVYLKTFTVTLFLILSKPFSSTAFYIPQFSAECDVFIGLVTSQNIATSSAFFIIVNNCFVFRLMTSYKITLQK